MIEISNRDVRLSYFAHSRDNAPKQLRMSWGEFVQGLGPHRYDIADKRMVPMFCPAEFREGKPRTKQNVLRVHIGVLDLDKISRSELVRICGILAQHDAVLYTTWSHNEPSRRAQDLWTCRVCVRLSKPVESAVWLRCWQAMSSYFGANDPSCKDANRCYFGPSAPPGTDPATMHYVVYQGKPLDVDELLSRPIERAAISRNDKISRDRLARLAQRWKRSRDTYRSEMGEVLGKLCKGEAFAEPGDIDNKIFQLCQDLAEEMPDADPASIAEHFAVSLQLMAWKGEYPITRVQEKLERALENITAENAEEQAFENAARRIRIREAFAATNPARELSYSEEEIQEFVLACKCSRDELTKRWIVQRGGSFYVLGPKANYSRPYTEKDVYAAIVRDLSPADTAGVEISIETEKGQRRKTLSELMADYGSVATNTILDLRASRASYEPITKTFTEAPCPLRDLEPTFDADVDAWLRIAMGDYIEDVRNWIAQVTDLNRTCAALLMIGPRDSGKTLLACGLSRLWCDSGPTPLESAIAEFNDKISACPLIFADEQMPKDFRGFDRTAEIRRFISDLSRPLKRKYMPEATIIGAIRLVVAANNDTILAMREHLSAHDIEAIGDRFYLVRINEKQAVVDGVPQFDKAGIEISEPAYFLSLCDTRSFVQEDRIAKHALWLRDNYPIRRDGRFLIQSKDREFYRGLATQSGLRSAVCEYCIRYLLNPSRVDVRGDFGILIKDGDLLVSASTMLDTWDIYVANEHVPPTGILSRTISELSLKQRHCAKPLKKGNGHYYLIDRKHLHAWGEKTGFATRTEIDQILSVPTETRILTPRNI